MVVKVAVTKPGPFAAKVLERLEDQRTIKRRSDLSTIAPSDHLALHYQAESKDGLRSFLEMISQEDEKFWTASKEQREEFLTYLINKAGGARKFLGRYPNTINSLINNFLPKDMTWFDEKKKESKKISVNQLGKDLFDNYLSKVLDDEYQAALLLEALLLVNYKVKQKQYPFPYDGDVAFGYKLCDFLVEIGAVKFAQKLDSELATPEAWNEGLQRSKYAAKPMNDEEFKALAKKRLPEKLWKASSIKENVGTGTYLDTCRIKIDDGYLADNPAYKDAPQGAEFVLQLVKPAAKLRSNTLLDIARKMQKITRDAKDPSSRFIKTVVPILEMIEDNIDEETDMRKAKPKADKFSELYPKMKLRSPSLDIEFRPAMIFDYDKGYRVNLLLKGDHFADLKTSKKRRKEIAMAILIAEFFLMFSGQAFDHDRHNANQKIEIDESGKRPKVIIGNFDENGLAPAPNKKQKKIIANLLMDLIDLAVNDGLKIPDALRANFELARVEPENSDSEEQEYINFVADALRGLNNYIKVLAKSGYEEANFVNKLFRIRETSNAVLEIAQVLRSTGKLDEDIVNQIKQRYQELKKGVKNVKRRDYSEGTKLTTKVANKLILKYADSMLKKPPKGWKLAT